MPPIRGLLICLVALIFAGCATRSGPVAPARSGPLTKSVYLINNDWHTGIGVRKNEVPGSWSVKDFPAADYLEAGWGNNRFYRAQKAGLVMAVRAAFPSESAIQVVGVKGSLASFFRYEEVLEVRVSPEGLQRLGQFVGETFQKNGQGEAVYLGTGVYGPVSRFYGAEGRYSIGTTCNVWTAHALQAAGIPVRPAMTAEGLTRQVRRFAVQREHAVVVPAGR